MQAVPHTSAVPRTLHAVNGPSEVSGRGLVPARTTFESWLLADIGLRGPVRPHLAHVSRPIPHMSVIWGFEGSRGCQWIV